jgi:hypothetical protein
VKPPHDALARRPWRGPVNYGDDLPPRLRAAAQSGHIDALLDFFGGGYVAMAVEDLGCGIRATCRQDPEPLRHHQIPAMTGHLPDHEDGKN